MSDIINKWSVLQNLSKDFVSTINSVYIFGTNGKQVIVITNDDNVYSFGDNDTNGCLGLGHTNPVKEPTKIVELCAKQVKQIEFSVDYTFVISVTQCGDCYSWGYNERGGLGIGNTISQCKPTIISALSDKNVVDIKSGSLHSLALTITGDTYVWGDPIGSSPTKMRFTAMNQKIIAISSGSQHALALTNNGSVYYWGNNSFGQCGNGSNNNSNVTVWCESVKTADLSVTKIACGPHHSMILSTKGIVHCFGRNQFGQCGDGTSISKKIPTKVNINAKIVEIAATKQYSISVGLSDNGYCYVWGKCGKEAFNDPFDIPCNNLIQVIEHYSGIKIPIKPLIFTNDNISAIMDRIADKFNKREFSDIAFKVEDKCIYAQKSHLSNVCKYFEAMFSDNQWLESKSPEIEIIDYSYNVYYAFIKYLYTDCVEINTDEDALELMDLANCYLDEALKQRCVQLIKNSIKNENVFAIYCSAIKYNLKDLRAFCIEFVQNNTANKTYIEAIMDNAVKFTEK